MASTASGRRLSDAHRDTQSRLLAQATEDALRLWQMLPVDDLDDMREVWLTAMLRSVGELRSESVSSARGYYRSFGQDEAGLVRDLPDVPDRLDRRAVARSLESTGPIRMKSLIGGGMPARQAWSTAAVAVAGSAARHVVDGGRQQLIGLANVDRQAIGFLRVTGQDPCAFCAMLASRGPVYKSRQSAGQVGFAADGRRNVSSRVDGDGYHDACQCTVEPMFDFRQQWPGRGREFHDLWYEVQSEARDAGLIRPGSSGRDALNAFRRRLERGQVAGPGVRRPSAPRAPHRSLPARDLPDIPASQPMTAERVASRIADQRRFAETYGWDVTVDGRRMVGVRPGDRIVWELSDAGVWLVAA